MGAAWIGGHLLIFLCSPRWPHFTYNARVEASPLSLADRVAERALADLPSTLARLTAYLRIPAISCEPSGEQPIRQLCQQLQTDLQGLGFARTRVLELPGALPLVCAESASPNPSLPTLLLYGHLDLQPVAGEAWSTPPHEATRKGERLYARGAADDMGGWVSHLAAVGAWREVSGALPVNIKWVLESEEEIGSPNLERYMDAFPGAFEADAMVLTDCENPAVDVPGLTTSLRGLLEIKLSVEALRSDVHSGIWGNLAPDPSLALMLAVSRLVDSNGRFRLAPVEVSMAAKRELAGAPLSPAVVREGARLREGVDPLPPDGRSAAEWAWRQPAVTVLSTSLPRPGAEKNAIRARAEATLSIRLAPGQTAQAVFDAVQAALEAPVAGLAVSLERLPGAADSWLYEPAGPAFDAADRAYQRAWGQPLMRVGIGGSIPFVALFGRRFSHLPLILNGVMDPETGAHGPDESLHLGVFEKAIVASVYLYSELGMLGPAHRWSTEP